MSLQILGNQAFNTNEEEYIDALYENKPDFWALPSNYQFWIQGTPLAILDVHPRKLIKV